MEVDLIAVQADLRPDDYRSPEAFRSKVVGLAERAVAGLDPGPRLIAYPEAIALPLVFALAGQADAPSGWRAALNAGWQCRAEVLRLGWAHRTFGRAALWLPGAVEADRVYREAFAEAARVSGAVVVAGSLLLPEVDREPARGWHLVHAELRNRSSVFGPDGRLLGETRKVRLMPAERAAGARSGSLAELHPVATPVGPVGVAICLDAFHERVVARLDALGARIVVQPSANHASWERRWPPDPRLAEGEAWLRHGLRAMVQSRQHVVYGVNPMLVGEVWDLRPRGRSSIVANLAALPPGTQRDRAARGVEGWPGVLALAPDAEAEAIVRVAVELPVAE